MAEPSSLIAQPPCKNSADHRVQKPLTAAHQLANGSSGLNPRSCLTCRRRKVRCDKKSVCTNCIKARIECIYPSPGRAPRKPRKPADSYLIDRLEKLEGVVQFLGSQAPPEDGESPFKGEATLEGAGDTHEQRINRAWCELTELKKQKREQEQEQEDDREQSPTGLEGRFGRLVVDEGRSRYLNPSFWAILATEVEDIKEILNDNEDDCDDDHPSPVASQSSAQNQGFIFGLSSQNVDMLALHPRSEHVPIYWNLYKENVDAILKVFHAPSTEPIILQARDRLDKIPRGLEALLFCIYFGAVTSISEEDCRTSFGEDKGDLLVRYRFGIEQALARADFLQTDEIIVVQAFLVFLICLRRNGDGRIIWTLTGLLVRMAQNLGLHRDGSHFDLPPFQVEMRRRLWWQICTLDLRANEDFGSETTTVDREFDTKLPLNVNDSDLDPAMTSFPESRLGCTEMTFGLIRFEIASTLRRLQDIPIGPRKCDKSSGVTSLGEKETWIRECHQHLEDRYLKECDMTVPLYWVTATVARLIISKMWLMIYQPFHKSKGRSSLPQEIRDKLWVTSLENVEYSLLLETEERTRQWGWLFRTYIQWHALAFMLTELCIRTEGEQVDRAWKAIEFIIARRVSDDQTTSNRTKGHSWKPLRRLMKKARVEREKARARKYEDQVTAQAFVETSMPSVHEAMSSFDPAVPIMNLDFSAERLFPPDTIPNDTPTNTNWINPITNSTIMSTSSLGPSTNVTTTANQTIAPTTLGDPTFSRPFDMDDQWSFGHAKTSIESPSFLTTPLTVSSLPADGTVDWEAWDDMVEQFGMDIDQDPPIGLPQPNTFSSFGGYSNSNWY